LIIDNNRLDYGEAYPESFIKNYQLLLQFDKNMANDPISRQLNELLEKYDRIYQRIVIVLVEERISYLKSYLNQSRYGLARLFDNNREAPGNE
jgi:hypothetical protein